MIDTDKQELEGYIDDLCTEIIILQEKIKDLEKMQSRPDNAFWGQLMFDCFVFMFVVASIIVWFGR